MKLAPHAGNFTYYASIILDAFYAYYAQNYAGIIGTSLVPIIFNKLNLLTSYIHIWNNMQRSKLLS